MTPLASLLKRETELVSRFILILGQELEALKSGSPDQLNPINSEKLVLVGQLNQLGLERTQLADLTGTATDRVKMATWLQQHPHEKQSATLWIELLKLAQEAKELHEVNGTFIRAHLQRTTDAISVLTQQHKEHSLYGSNGQSAAFTGSRIVDSA